MIFAPGRQGLMRALAWSLVLSGLALGSAVSYAQVVTTITPDATLPIPSSVVQSGTTFDINAGTPAGTNLFHSFSQFDVGTGATANFNAPSGTTNILTRVTGGSLSQIDGTLTATDLGTGGLASANLFLLNPAGILFGENAQLNLAGSFHASTADYLELGSDGIFYANTALGSDVLTTSPPSAFGFLTAPPGPSGCPNACIEVQSSAGDGLKVTNNQTLSLVGGPIVVGNATGSTPGRLLALGALDPVDTSQTEVAGRINLVSVAAAGEAPFDGTNINVDDFTQLGDIAIQRNSIIDAREIYIRAGQLTLTNALVFPGATPVIFEKFTQPNGGEVNVKATNDVTVSGSTFISGPGGSFLTGIRTQAGSPAAITTTGAADITIEAGSASITGRATVRSERFGPGNAADISISADSLTISNGGTLNVSNFYAGSGGSVIVNAQQLEISRTSSRLGFTGIAGQATFHPGWGGAGFSTDPALTSAEGGTVTINVPGSLTLRQGNISATSFSLGSSGDVTINTGDLFLLDGSEIASQGNVAGDSGNVRVKAAGTLQIDGASSRISSATLGSGDAGVVAINTEQSISLSDGGAISSTTVPVPDSDLDALATRALGRSATFTELVTDLGLDPATADIFDVLNGLNARGWTAVADLTPGDAGKISITAPELTMSGDTEIRTTTFWDGNAGVIEGNVGNLSLNGGAEITSRSGGIRLDNGQVSIGAGSAGAVSFTAADTISVAGAGSGISTATFGDGTGGSIVLNAGKEVTVQDGGSVSASSGGQLDGQTFVGAGPAGEVTIAAADTISVSGTDSTVSSSTLGAGDGGTITLTADEVLINAGANVTAESFGTGDAGTVVITATGPNTLTISGQGSTVSTTTSAGGDGGDINLGSAGNVEVSNGGSVTADSEGTGNTGEIEITAGNSIVMSGGTISTRAETSDGGNIKLTAPGQMVYLLDSDITTSVESGKGGGGNINIDPKFIILNNSQITANAFGGPGGNITLIANNFLPSANSIVQASSALSTQGTIVIQSPENDIAGSIAQLPQTIVDVSGLLPERCAARHAGAAQSSFVVAGRGGLPTNPDNYLPSFNAGSGPLKTGDTTSPTMSRSELHYVNDTAVALAGWGCRR